MASAAPRRRRALTAYRRIPGPPHDPAKARLLRLHVALLGRFGPQRWWPARGPYEVAVGAILTQNTAWTNAARAVAALRAARLLSPRRLVAIPEAELGAVIRSAGTYRLKARRLLDFTRWLLERHGGRFRGLRRAPLLPLRAELLGVPGLGPETVDAILLYAADRPVFVADAYARRVLAGHRLIPAEAGYEEARAFVEAHVPSDPALLNELHALLVAAGKADHRTPRAAGLTRAPARPRSAPPHRERRGSSRARPSPGAGAAP
jgi:endonuclease-3 related protein